MTPNWQCQLPGFPYRGPDPHGFMLRNEIVAYIDAFVASFNPPIREGVAVRLCAAIRSTASRSTPRDGRYVADQVVVAAGGYQDPDHSALRRAARPPTSCRSIRRYIAIRSQLPPGPVLVVGSGQSGCQIAEDLHLAGRKVHLCVGDAPRVSRRYRGKDVVEWLHLMGYYELPVHEHPLREGVRDKTNHYVTGRDGGRDIDLRQRALEGMELYGRLLDVSGDRLVLDDDLAQCLDQADQVSESIKTSIDGFIAKQGHRGAARRPATDPCGCRPANARNSTIGRPESHRSSGASVFAPTTAGSICRCSMAAASPPMSAASRRFPASILLGLPWLYTWGSGRFSGVAGTPNISPSISNRKSARTASTPRRPALTKLRSGLEAPALLDLGFAEFDVLLRHRIVFLHHQLIGHGARILARDVIEAGIGAGNQLDLDRGVLAMVRPRNLALVVGAPT